MSKYDSSRVNVGALINPAEGLSRSLLNLSGVYGKQAALEQAEEQKNLDRESSEARHAANLEESRLGRLAAQQRHDDAQLLRLRDDKRKADDHKIKQDTIKARQELGKFVTSGGIRGHKFNLDDAPSYIKDKISSDKKRLEQGKTNFLNYAKGAQTPEELEAAMKAFDDNFVTTGNTAHDINARNARTVGYRRLALQLAGISDPEEKQKFIDGISEKMFGTALNQIQSDIDTGKYLTLTEKQNSVISRLPEWGKYLDRKTILGEVGGNLQGTTRKELIAQENKRVEDFNKAAMSAYKSGTSYSNKNGKEYSSKDLKDLYKEINAVDIGPNDNKLVQKAATSMLKAGHHPTAVVTAIHAALNENKDWYGDSFVSNDGKSSDFERMFNASKKMSEQFKSGGSSGNRMAPLRVYTPDSVEKIRTAGVSNYRAGRLRDYVPEGNQQRELDLSQIPTKDSLNGVANAVRPEVPADQSVRQFSGHSPDIKVNNERAERYKADVENVKATNKTFGKDTITTDTLFVYPHDSEGKPTTWAEQVKDANSRSAIKFGDEISRDEYEEAKNNPKLQAEHLNRINRLIADDTRFQAATGSFFDRVKRSAENVGGRLAAAIGDTVSSDFDPTKGSTREWDKAVRDLEKQEKYEGYARIENFINNYQNRPDLGSNVGGKMVDAFKGFLGNSPSTAFATSSVMSALPLGRAIKGVVDLGKVRTIRGAAGKLSKSNLASSVKNTSKANKNSSSTARSKPKNRSEVKQERKRATEREIKNREKKERLREENAPGQKPRLEKQKQATEKTSAMNKARKWKIKKESLESLAKKGNKKAIRELELHLKNKPKYRLPPP